MVISACQDNRTTNPGFGREQLDAALQIAEIEGKTYDLSVYLARDYMPPIPPGGRPLRGFAYLIDTDSLEIPNNIDIDMMWVFNGSDIWATELIGEQDRELPYRLGRHSGDDPKWEPGTLVDVLVRIVYEDQTYFIKELDVPIVISE